MLLEEGYDQESAKERTAITDVNYEPWPYRYVCRETAAKIMERRIRLEEYLAEEDT